MFAPQMNPHNLYSQNRNRRGMVVPVALVAPGVLQVPWDLGVLPARSAPVCRSFLLHPEHPEVATKAVLIPPQGAEAKSFGVSVNANKAANEKEGLQKKGRRARDTQNLFWEISF